MRCSPLSIPTSAALDEILDSGRARVPRSSSASATTPALARSLRRIADVHWLRCRVAPGEPLLERALEHARRAGDDRELSEIRQALIRGAAIGPMPVDAAMARCEAIIAESGGDPLTEAVAANALGYLNAMAGRFARGPGAQLA